jgi:beta-galactosidase GanA
MRGAAMQLIVDGDPFIILGGELHNSSSSSLDYMKPIWPKLAAAGLNTVVTPLSWELIEPREGHYDFTLVDGLLAQARATHEHIVFLWLASWKNGMSSYAPVWVKQDTRRFPRVVENGSEVEILSPLGEATQQADAAAFAALMRHIKQADSTDHTVLMMQVENEVGVLGDTRDHSTAANHAFDTAVPVRLTAYLKEHHDTLYPALRTLWDQNGDKAVGNWTEVFGNTERADEIFMAWHYARFIQAVAAQGKTAYNIPMYVNTWLAGDDTTPGDYPSGGPEPWVVDVWKAAGSALDLFAPDLYDPHFAEWCKRYHRDGNPLFMPETRGGEAGAADVFYAIGQENGFGFSPFAIEDEADPKSDLAASYNTLSDLVPLITERQSAGAIRGFVLSADHPSVDFTMGGYTLHVTLDEIFGSRAHNGYGLIMFTGTDEFLGAGKGFRVTFIPRDDATRAGIAAVDEGTFQDGKWVPGRRLNGDENDQGKAWRFGPRQLHIENVTLYHYSVRPPVVRPPHRRPASTGNRVAPQSRVPPPGDDHASPQPGGRVPTPQDQHLRYTN